ncbi:putative L-type lectin-domain containing receptor kinase I.1 [Jatropha curcas]|uniref:putative L-type lectin-domain containing receptor kinase I.1 n=1 Tax=Jatropha curcas TaxID=180498 RepID=UPI001895AE1A|nr:putative L-type lectin-domain containing receptor kinase I.1 [Jatropha curcas]
MFSLFKLFHFLLYSFVFLKQLALAAKEENQFIYHGFNETDLHTNGIAKIHKNGLLELTNLSAIQIGRAFIPFPLKFNDHSSENSQSLSFSTNFVFAILPQLANLGGHGFTFTISPSIELTGGEPIQYFGLFNSTTIGLSSNHIFAVEFDTILTPDFRDIDNNHIGVDVNGLISNVSASAAYYSEEERENKSLELISGNPMQVWIDYDDVEKLINVTLAPITIKKPEKPLLSTNLDLSLVFLDSMYVGFSSSLSFLGFYVCWLFFFNRINVKLPLYSWMEL